MLPGERHVYRFRPDQVGTFWYHSHQIASKQVRRGLFGALVIEPREAPTAVLDLAVVAHELGGRPTLDGNDGVRQRRRSRPGTPVRLRLVNAENSPRRFTVSGTSFRVLAIDGTDLTSRRRSTDTIPRARSRRPLRRRLHDARGRPSRLRLPARMPAVVSRPRRRARPATCGGRADFDPLAYGSPAPTPFDRASHSTATSRSRSAASPGSSTGGPDANGRSTAESTPMSRSSSSAKATSSRSRSSTTPASVHPMHLHGHHALVLSAATACPRREARGGPTR